jgi:cation:H+ antiporter
MTVVTLVVGLLAVLAGALLFTNAVEWAGARMSLGVGAVGTLLAGVSTALPESIIPALAILRDEPRSDEVAIGAIIGAPFMLATIAMALVGVTAIAYRGRRAQGQGLDVHRETLRRDLTFFVVLLSAAALLGLGAPAPVRVAAAVGFVLAYLTYAVLTVRRGGKAQAEDELPPLVADPTKDDPPPTWTIAVQFAAGLALILGGAHFVVDGLIHLADLLGVSALVLALIVAPLATELPEKANSFLWIREGKDSLALGNITGALVFQSAIPVALGVALTPWELGPAALLAATLALCGGGVAWWSLHGRARFSSPAIFGWALLFTTFVVGVWMVG